MRRSTLDVDSRYNIFRGRYSDSYYWFSYQLAYELPSIAKSNLHKIFDKNEWLLMPEESVVKKFYDSLHSVGSQLHAKRKKIPDFSVCLLIMTYL